MNTSMMKFRNQREAADFVRRVQNENGGPNAKIVAMRQRYVEINRAKAGRDTRPMTTVRAPELYTPRKRWPPAAERIKPVLLANPGICPAILAADLGVSEMFVIRIQRWLGIRKLTSPSAYRKPKRT